jgi:predicted metalloendopeptidase
MTPPTLAKKCVTDSEMGKICSTGQYSTYAGNFYKNPDNIARFKEIAIEFKKDKKYKGIKTQKKRYTKFLVDKFQERNISKVVHQIKNDYFTYANEEWMKTKDTEDKYYVQYDNFRIKQEEVYYKLIDYVKTYIKENPTSEKAIALKNVYNSLKDDTRKAMYKHVEAVLSELERYVTGDDMYGLLAMINSNETISWCSPIRWNMIPDEKNVKQYINHMNFGQLGLYDVMIYFDLETDDHETKLYKKKVKREYFHYIGEVFKACLGARAHKYNPQDIWDVETEILMAMGCTGTHKSSADQYNKVSAHELETTYAFDWPTFTKKMGYKSTPAHSIVGNLNGFGCMVKLLKEKWNTPKWQTFWAFIQFKQMIRFEDSLRSIHYNFYNHFLEGQTARMPSEIYPIFGLSLLFNTFLSEQYVEHNYNPLYVNYVNHLSSDLKELFIKKIEVNTWLSPSTKKSALLKLHKLVIMVGKPDQLRYDPLFKYVDNDPLVNVGMLVNWKHKKSVALEGKPVIDLPEFDWNVFKLVGTQCYTVNAYYRPNSNSIYVPLAYLQKPFIDLEERGLEYNLVYIGYTLGHELSHALDNTGSKYDAYGNLHNWWTEADHTAFKEKIANVKIQYETFAKRDGIDFNADMSIGEDLADISGMALVEAYLLDNQIINNENSKIKKMNLAKLYLNMAIQAQQKISKKAIKAQLKINPHPLAKYRVNCCLARLELFKTIYGIKKGDGMWWNNDTIW